MHKRDLIVGLFVGSMVLSTGAANAATISATAGLNEIKINEATQVDIFLDLAPGEVASVFEGRFDLVGNGTVVDTSISNAGGITWDSSFGNIAGNQVILSLTSDNQEGNRLVGTLDLVGLSLGNFQLLLGSPTFASFDIDVAPFLENLNISNPDGDLLASVQVVPIPAAFPLFGAALAGLFVFARRRQTC